MIVFGLTEEDLKKSTITEVSEVQVYDGKGGAVTVKIGDKVEVYKPEENKSTLEYLGPGPYTIEWLAEWRCGVHFLQLTTPHNGTGKGVNANKIRIA